MNWNQFSKTIQFVPTKTHELVIGFEPLGILANIPFY